MIVTIAKSKGGAGNITLVRALSGTVAHAGNDVFLIDADSRANTMRWVTMSKQMDVWPDRLEAESCLDPNQIYKLALHHQQEGKIVFLDGDGAANGNLFTGYTVPHRPDPGEEPSGHAACQTSSWRGSRPLLDQFLSFPRGLDRLWVRVTEPDKSNSSNFRCR